MEVLRLYFLKVGHRPPTLKSPAELVKIESWVSDQICRIKICKISCEVLLLGQSFECQNLGTTED